MVRIRLRRVGLKKQPSYRIIITDQHNARGSEYLENIGYYNPRTEPPTNDVDEERALYWLSMGAQPSDAVLNILKRIGTWGRFERLRKGEALQALVEEANAARAAATPVSPKTRRPSPAAGQGRNAAEEAAS
ncbi:MAG TPA: 30S ribosomal protein S16 [Phototrophicaceae bacterium]|nr:30S ribosomal protein S16 [Phototrophicaceae bacterium]